MKGPLILKSMTVCHINEDGSNVTLASRFVLLLISGIQVRSDVHYSVSHTLNQRKRQLNNATKHRGLFTERKDDFQH